MTGKIWVAFILVAVLSIAVAAGAMAVWASPDLAPQAADPGKEMLSGVITKLAGTGFTLKNKTETPVVLASDAWVFVGGKEGKPSDLKEGQRVSVAGAKGADGAFTAKFVMARQDRKAAMARPKPGDRARRPGMMVGMLFGEVTNVDAATITIKNPAGEEKVAKVTDKTVVMKADRSKGTVTDITVGAKVMIGGRKNPAGELEAAHIGLLPAGFAPGAGPGWLGPWPGPQGGPQGHPGGWPRMPRMPRPGGTSQ